MKKINNYLKMQQIGHFWAGEILHVEYCTVQQQLDISLLAIEQGAEIRIEFL